MYIHKHQTPIFEVRGISVLNSLKKKKKKKKKEKKKEKRKKPHIKLGHIRTVSHSV